MSGCVLRASGADFDVDRFLLESPFQPCRVFRRGERRSRGSERVVDESGFNLVVSDADGDHLADQIHDAVAFLQSYRGELLRLARCAGLSESYLDFGCSFPCQITPGRFHRLPLDLIRACAEIGVAIELSVYAVGTVKGTNAEN